MALATLTKKGQITIPKEIRDSLELTTGDKIEILLIDEREAVIRPGSKKVDDIFGRLHKPGRKTASVEAMKNAVIKRMRDRFQ